MLEFYYSSESESLAPIGQIRKGCWIDMLAPSDKEIFEISRLMDVELDFLKDPLDSEERSRIEFDENKMLLIMDIPIVEFAREGDQSDFKIETLPLGMIFLPDYIITVCLKKTPILAEFKMGRLKNLATTNKNTFLLLLLQKIATYYLRYLRHINRKTEETEMQIRRSTKNKELFELLSLEKTLVYFTTSLSSNKNLLARLIRSKQFIWTENEQELFEDVTIEFDQAIEMTQIYSDILSNLMDSWASVVSNNLNIVMKLLTSITIVLAIPTMISSFFGMNVGLPYQNHPFMWLFIIIGTFVLAGIAITFLYKKKLF